MPRVAATYQIGINEQRNEKNENEQQFDVARPQTSEAKGQTFLLVMKKYYS